MSQHQHHGASPGKGGGRDMMQLLARASYLEAKLPNHRSGGNSNNAATAADDSVAQGYGASPGKGVGVPVGGLCCPGGRAGRQGRLCEQGREDGTTPRVGPSLSSYPPRWMGWNACSASVAEVVSAATAATSGGGGNEDDDEVDAQCGVPIKRLSVSGRTASFVAADPSVKRLAEKTFPSCVRLVVLMPKKEVFRVTELPLDDFASSLGFASTPSLFSTHEKSLSSGDWSSLPHFSIQVKSTLACQFLGLVKIVALIAALIMWMRG